MDGAFICSTGSRKEQTSARAGHTAAGHSQLGQQWRPGGWGASPRDAPALFLRLVLGRSKKGSTWGRQGPGEGATPPLIFSPELVASGGHADAKVFPQLLQEHEGEHSVWD